MNPSIANPTVSSFFESATVGDMYARCFMTVLAILVLLYAVNQVWRMRQGFHLLDQAAKSHRAGERATACDVGREAIK